MRQTIDKVLLWSQKYTKADMRYIASGGSWLLFSQGVNSALSLVLLVAFANMLSKEAFGIYRYILSIAAVMNICTLSGVHAAITRSVAAGNDGVLRAVVHHQLRWNLIMVGAFLCTSGFYYVRGDMLFASSLLVLGIFVPATLALNTYGSYLNGKRMFRMGSVASVLTTLVYVIGMFTTLMVTDDIFWLISVYTVTAFIPALYFYRHVLRVLPESGSGGDAAEVIGYAKKLSLIGLIGPIASQVDKIVLVQFWGPAQLATYTLAMALPGKIVPYLKRFVNLGSPKFAAKSTAQLHSVFYRRIFQGMAIGFAISLAYILLSPFVFTHLLPQYVDGLRYSQILSLSFIFAMPNRYIALLFESQKMTRYIFATNLINSILSIVLYVTLGIWGGIMGLVIAYVLWCLIGFVINYVSWLMGLRTTKHSR